MRQNYDNGMTKLSQALETPAQDLSAQIDVLKQEMQNLSAQVLKFFDQEKRSLTGSAKKAAADVNAALDAYGIKTDVLTEAVKDKAGELQRTIISEVRTNPVRAIAITVGIGLVIGALSRGK